MKTIGLIGGMSWESSLLYYRLMNEIVRDRLGELHSARCLMYSVDFAEIECLQRENRWEAAGETLAEVARRLELGGAECIVLCTNTMHKVADIIQARTTIPFLHIAEVTARRIKAARLGIVGLLGTRFTMEQDFYKSQLRDPHGLTVVIPSEPARQLVHRVIYDELCRGEIRPESRRDFSEIMKNMVGAGAEGIILGCTEIGLLVKDEDTDVPLFDTTKLHVEAAVDFALS